MNNLKLNAMKKLLYLFIACTIFISCESDNDSDLDPIIGTWQLQSIIEDDVEQTTECSRKTTIVFLQDGTTTADIYEDDGNNCNNFKDTSTWVNKGNSTYRIKVDDADSKLTFSQNNTVFTGGTSETFNGVTYTTVITYKKK